MPLTASPWRVQTKTVMDRMTTPAMAMQAKPGAFRKKLTAAPAAGHRRQRATAEIPRSLQAEEATNSSVHLERSSGGSTRLSRPSQAVDWWAMVADDTPCTEVRRGTVGSGSLSERLGRDGCPTDSRPTCGTRGRPYRISGASAAPGRASRWFPPRPTPSRRSPRANPMRRPGRPAARSRPPRDRRAPAA